LERRETPSGGLFRRHLPFSSSYKRRIRRQYQPFRAIGMNLKALFAAVLD
jgi:hypothetical protein